MQQVKQIRFFDWKINSLFLLVLLPWMVLVYAFSWGKTELQICQESYMKSTNAVQRYNEENPEWKVELPKYNCNVQTFSGGKLPPPSEVTKWKFDLESLHMKVCKKQINSPLCKDFNLFDRLYQITEARLPWKNMFPILIGITNAESSLWLNFANDKVWGKCNWRNNWGWTKYQILDNNTRVYSRKLNWFDYSNSVDQYGCNLYPFESIEEFWITKVNWMRYGYKSCIESNTPIKCISYNYVGNKHVAEQSWINNVSLFLN